jgi:hydroxyethylthiazole kinase-like uncharacterized protein yjeF
MSIPLTAALVRPLLPPRPADGYKGTFGTLLAIAGSITCPGAASLATAAAARVGAGLVTLAVGRSALAGPGRIPELVLRILPEAEFGYLGEAAADELIPRLDDYRALLVGPGIGRDDSTRDFICRLMGIRASGTGRLGFLSSAVKAPPRPELPPVVIDADALTLLAGVDGWWERMPAGRAVLTPHLGEMARLLGTADLIGDPCAIAGEAAARWRQVVVLKKSGLTVIADPAGAVALHDRPNAALATAGTGDVLAGCIAGLLVQGIAPFAAARAGVHLHAEAGALAAAELGDSGVLASDLLPLLPRVIKALKHG